MFKNHKTEKLELSKYSEDLMRKIQARLITYKPKLKFQNKQMVRDRKAEFVYLRILEKTQKFFEMNPEIFAMHRTPEAESRVEKKLKRHLKYMQKLHDKKELGYLNNEVTRLFALKEKFSNWEELEETEEMLKRLRKHKLMTSGERALLELVKAKRKMYQKAFQKKNQEIVRFNMHSHSETLFESSIVFTPIIKVDKTKAKSFSRLQNIMTSNIKSMHFGKTAQVYKQQFNFLQNENEEQVQDEHFFNQNMVQCTHVDTPPKGDLLEPDTELEELMRKDTETMYKSCKSMEFNVNYLVKDVAVSLKAKKQQLVSKYPQLGSMLDKIEDKLTGLGNDQANKSEEPLRPPEEPEAGGQMFTLIQKKVLQSKSLNEKAQKLIQGVTSNKLLQKQLSAFYRRSNKTLEQFVKNLDNVKETQQSVSVKCENQLKNMNHQYQVSSFIEQLETVNFKAAREGNIADIVVPTFKLDFDSDKHLEPMIRADKRSLTAEEKDKFAINQPSRASFYWNYAVAGMVIGAAIAMTVAFKVPLWGSIASACFGLGLLVLKNYKSEDENEFSSKLSDYLETVWEKKDDMQGLVVDLCQSTLQSSSPFGYAMSMGAVKLMFGKKDLKSVMRTLQGEFNEKSYNANARQLDERQIEINGQSVSEAHTKSQDLMEEINDEVFEAKAAEYKEAMIENEFLLSQLFDWTEEVLENRDDADNIDNKYRAKLKEFFGFKKQIETSLEHFKSKVFICRENHKMYRMMAETLADKQVAEIRGKSKGVHLAPHFTRAIEQHMDEVIYRHMKDQVESKEDRDSVGSGSTIDLTSSKMQNQYTTNCRLNIFIFGQKVDYAEAVRRILRSEDMDSEETVRANLEEIDRERGYIFSNKKMKSEFREQVELSLKTHLDRDSEFNRVFREKFDKVCEKSRGTFKLILLHGQYKMLN